MEKQDFINKNDAFVTVIVPAYNVEKYIGKCIDSLLEQRYKNYEMIIINDGSCDNTGEICEEYARREKRITVIHTENRGVSEARNLGLKKANGEYIVFVDSDDFVSENYLELLVEGIVKNDVDLCCVDYYEVYSNKTICHADEDDEKNMVMSETDAINLLHKKEYFRGYLWDKIFIKKIIDENQIIFDKQVKIWEDMLFCLKYMINCRKVLYIRKPVYYYIIRANSAMNDSRIWNEGTHIYALEQMYDISGNCPGEFYNYIRDFYANDLVGRLGKNNVAEIQEIKSVLNKIDEIDGHLTLKHRIKYSLYKLAPRMMKSISSNKP